MQWWGALTQQFQMIAVQAMQELPGQTAVEAGKHMATALASEAVKTATEMTAGVARTLTAQADAVAQAKPGKPATAKPDGKVASKASASAKKGTSSRVSPPTKTVAKGAAPGARKATGQSAAKPAAPARSPQSAGAPRAKPVAKTSAKPAAKAGRAR
jgi:hypothetical protein